MKKKIKILIFSLWSLIILNGLFLNLYNPFNINSKKFLDVLLKLILNLLIVIVTLFSAITYLQKNQHQISWKKVIVILVTGITFFSMVGYYYSFN